MSRAMDVWAIVVANLEPKVVQDVRETVYEAHTAMTNVHHDIRTLRELARPHDQDYYAYEQALELHEVVNEVVAPCYEYVARVYTTMARIQVIAYMMSRVPINTLVREEMSNSLEELNEYFDEVGRIID